MNKFFQIAFLLLLAFALGVFGTLLIKGILNLIDLASNGVIGAMMVMPSSNLLRDDRDSSNASNWICYAADNLGLIRACERATVEVYLIKHSTKSVEWTKYWGRTTPSGAKEYKTTTGSHPSAYYVAIGDKAYWIPHSIVSKSWELHGGRKFIGSHEVSYLPYTTCTDTIDLPVWWLKKNVGVDWSDKVEPLGRFQFFAHFFPKRQRR